MTDTNNMTVSNLNVASLFANNIFEIPDYQRHYAWRENHCRDLFDDIISTSKERFMGYLTLIKLAKQDPIRDNFQNSYNRMLVVDGQQRLTSITLLLAAIIHVYKDQDRDTAENWGNRYLRVQLINGRVVNRLWVQPLDIENPDDPMRAFFEDILKFNEPISIVASSQRRLVRARNYFVKRVLEYKEEGNDLVGLYSSVVDRLMFVANTIANVAQAGDIFEGLNNRGKKLSPIENIKSYASYIIHAATDIDDFFKINGQTVTRNELLHDINHNAYIIFKNLDRLGRDSENFETELLTTAWSLIRPLSEEINLLDDTPRSDIALLYRGAFDLRTAVVQGKGKDLAVTIAKVMRRLAKASKWYADVKRPGQEESFQEKINQSDRNEVKLLCQRLQEYDAEERYLPMIYVLMWRKVPLIKALRFFEIAQSLFILFNVKLGSENRLPVTFEFANNFYHADESNEKTVNQHIIGPILGHFYRRIRDTIPSDERVDAVQFDRRSCDYINDIVATELDRMTVNDTGAGLFLYETCSISFFSYSEFLRFYNKKKEFLRLIPYVGGRNALNALHNALPEGFGEITLPEYRGWMDKFGNIGVNDKLLKKLEKDAFDVSELREMAFDEKMRHLGLKEEEWSSDFAETLDRERRDKAKKRWRLTVDFSTGRIRGDVREEDPLEIED